jgi:hypothetical protein
VKSLLWLARALTMIMFRPNSLYFKIGKGDTPMAVQVCWLDSLAKAQDNARKTGKPVLLDFYNPQ